MVRMTEEHDDILETLAALQEEAGDESVKDSQLAHRLGIDVETLREALDELEEEGYVEISRVGPVQYEVRVRN